MASPSNQVVTTTNRALVKGLADNILGSNVGFTRMVLAAKKWKSGRQFQKSLKVSKNTQGGAYTGMQQFSTNQSDTRVKYIDDAAFYEKPVVIAGTDLVLNRATGGKVEDLMEIEIESTWEDLADDMGTDFYGVQTGNTINGLENLVDDGTNAANIGGLSRTTYSVLNSTVTGSGGTLSLDKMRTLLNNTKSGSQRPTIGLTTEAVFGFYEKLLQTQERISKVASIGPVKGMRGGTGFVGLDYAGIPILADEKATSGVLYFINENFLDLIALPNLEAGKKAVPMKATIEGNDYSSVRGLGFTWSDWIRPSNADGLIGHIYWGGQFVNVNPRFSGKLTAIAGV